MKSIQKILVIRFRQIGDSILAAAMCSSLKRSFPTAEIHLVLNAEIAPIFEEHPDIDRVITFAKSENKSFCIYLRKVWRVVHKCRYDVIIDMRSTIRTLFFSLFSLHTPYRIGHNKSYTRFLLNHRVDIYGKKPNEDMVQCNEKFIFPLESIASLCAVREFKLYLREYEKLKYRRYMETQGVDFRHPVMLVGVTTKLVHKKWNEGFMKVVLQRIMLKHPTLQLIFNYAPGIEEADARRIFFELGMPHNIKIDVVAKSLRELMALCANSSFYFGNEGGCRHMVQSLGIPSFAIYSPDAHKFIWLPKNAIPAEGISSADIFSQEKIAELSYEECFNLITPEAVCERLFPYLDKFIANN